MLYFGVELQPAGMARFQNTTTKRSTVFWLGIWVTLHALKLNKDSTVFWRGFLGEKKELLCFGI